MKKSNAKSYRINEDVLKLMEDDGKTIQTIVDDYVRRRYGEVVTRRFEELYKQLLVCVNALAKDVLTGKISQECFCKNVQLIHGLLNDIEKIDHGH